MQRFEFQDQRSEVKIMTRPNVVMHSTASGRTCYRMSWVVCVIVLLCTAQ